MFLSLFAFTIISATLLAYALGGASRRQPARGLLPVHESSSRFGTVQVRELRVPPDFHSAFTACRDAVLRIDGAAVRGMSREEGTLRARVPASWRAWGETVDIEVILLDEYATYVRVRSRPILSTTMLDYGKNRDNVDAIVQAISMACAPRLTHEPASA